MAEVTVGEPVTGPRQLIAKPGVFLLVCVCAPVLVIVSGVVFGGAIGPGLITGGLLALIMTFSTGLVTHWCYTRASLTLALATVLVTMSMRLLSVLLTIVLLHEAERAYFLSSVLSMTGLLVLALLADAIFLALPSRSGPEETARG